MPFAYQNMFEEAALDIEYIKKTPTDIPVLFGKIWHRLTEPGCLPQTRAGSLQKGRPLNTLTERSKGLPMTMKAFHPSKSIQILV
jgi:hypothetical protein